MKLLIDTNIVLDVLLRREPYFEASRAVWTLVETGHAEGLLSAHAVTTIHYLVCKQVGAERTIHIMSALLRVFGVAAVDSAVVHSALQTAIARKPGDFEDDVTAAAARLSGCDFIVSRDVAGFRGSAVPCLTPQATIAPGFRR